MAKKTKKSVKKKLAKKKPARKTFKKAVKRSAQKVSVKMGKPIGAVTHFYSGIKVGIFKFNKPVKIGREIHVKGATTDFKTKIGGMQ